MRTRVFDLRQGSGHGVTMIEPSGRSANTDRHEEMESAAGEERKSRSGTGMTAVDTLTVGLVLGGTVARATRCLVGQILLDPALGPQGLSGQKPS